MLYHGKARWEYKTLRELFDELDTELEKFVPNYHYVFHNLGQISDDHLQSIHNKFLSASLLALKYSVLKDKLPLLIPTILSLSGDTNPDLQNSLVVYTFVNSELKEAEILELMASLPNPIKENVMNTLDIFIEKGRKEGIEKGHMEKAEKAVLNLIKGSILTDEQIASALEVSLDYVAAMRKDHEEMK